MYVCMQVRMYVCTDARMRIVRMLKFTPWCLLGTPACVLDTLAPTEEADRALKGCGEVERPVEAPLHQHALMLPGHTRGVRNTPIMLPGHS